jgi:hypothetical protein
MAPGDTRLYTRYPGWSVALYDGVTVVHFLLGGVGLALGYAWLAGVPLAAAYVVFAFVEMFLVMPLTVCPSCVYYRLHGSLCISGLNRVSQRIASPRDASLFAGRAEGVLCPNNLYLVALGFPIVAVVPGLILHLHWPVLIIAVALVALLLFRFFVLFPRVACAHCRAKNACPNAQSMGLAPRAPTTLREPSSARND